MGHIFISYSRKNQKYARDLADTLLKRGFDVWIDDRIDYGSRWWRTITQAIEDCSAFVVIMSPPAEKSEWVEREVMLAQREEKPIFPLLLEGKEFALLITTQFVDVRHGKMPPDDFYTWLEQVIQPKTSTGEFVAPPEPAAIDETPVPVKRDVQQKPPGGMGQLFKQPNAVWMAVVGVFLVVAVLVGAVVLFSGDNSGKNESETEIPAAAVAEESEEVDSNATPSEANLSASTTTTRPDNTPIDTLEPSNTPTHTSQPTNISTETAEATYSPASTVQSTDSSASNLSSINRCELQLDNFSDTEYPETIIDLLSSDEHFTILLSLLNGTQLTETINGEGPFTIFAPTDEAFEALPPMISQALLDDSDMLTNVLLSHVSVDILTSEKISEQVSEESQGCMLQTLSDSSIKLTIAETGPYLLNGFIEITTADIQASNGVIHIIDAVVLPNLEGSPQSVVDVAASDERFDKLVTGLYVAELAQDLRGEGPFTVFAPTDEAFEKMPPGLWDTILGSLPSIQAILYNHIGADRLTSEDITTLLAESEEGVDLETVMEAMPFVVTQTEDGLVINGEIAIIEADIEAYNGVIHVIDTVLVPARPGQ